MSFEQIAESILSDPDYQNANLATKQVVFARLIAKTPEYANANAETQNAIMQQFGIAEPAEVAKAPRTEGQPAETAGTVKITPETALGVGAAAGASSLLAPKVTGASESYVMRARDRLAEAQNRLKSAQDAVAKGPGDVTQLRAAQDAARAEVMAAREELMAAQQAVREAAKTAPAVISEAAEALPSRTVPGASGAQNWARAMATQELPESLIEQVQTMRKTGEGGAQRLIDEDLARLQKIRELGESEQRLVGQGRGQLMLPPEEAARIEAELAKKQAAQAAEQARLQEIAERERMAREAELQQRQKGAKGKVQAAGERARQIGEEAKEAKRLAGKLETAQSKLAEAQRSAQRAEKSALNRAQSFGASVGSSKIWAPILGGLAGVGTLMSVDEAIRRFQAGDYSGAVIPTLEAAFGAMSMMPAWNPVTAGIKGLGTAGGLGLMAYELGKYGLQKAKE